MIEKDVLEIRKRYIPRKMSTWKLAREYGVSQTTIRYAIAGKNWGHV